MTRNATLDLGEENERRCQQKRAIEGMQSERAGAGHGLVDLAGAPGEIGRQRFAGPPVRPERGEIALDQIDGQLNPTSCRALRTGYRSSSRQNEGAWR